MKEALPVRHYGANSSGDYYRVNETFHVKHFTNDRLCCFDCRSATCEHVRAVEKVLGREVTNTKRVA